MSKFQIYKDRKGEFHWRLRAANGEIIADSNEGYARKADCQHAIEVVKKEAPAAPVEEEK